MEQEQTKFKALRQQKNDWKWIKWMKTQPRLTNCSPPTTRITTHTVLGPSPQVKRRKNQLLVFVCTKKLSWPDQKQHFFSPCAHSPVNLESFSCFFRKRNFFFVGAGTTCGALSLVQRVRFEALAYTAVCMVKNTRGSTLDRPNSSHNCLGNKKFLKMARTSISRSI